MLSLSSGAAVATGSRGRLLLRLLMLVERWLVLSWLEGRLPLVCVLVLCGRCGLAESRHSDSVGLRFAAGRAGDGRHGWRATDGRTAEQADYI